MIRWGKQQYMAVGTACKSLKASKEQREEAIEVMVASSFLPSMETKALKKTFWIVKNIMAWDHAQQKSEELMEKEESKAILEYMNKPKEERDKDEQERLMNSLQIELAEMDWDD
jgi:hypothetical protein